MSITKTTKRLLAVFAALVMALAVAVPAFAATITINNAVSGESYVAYKLFDVSVTSDGQGYSYYTTSQSLVEALSGDDKAGLTFTKAASEDVWYLTGGLSDNSDAAALAQYIHNNWDVTFSNLLGNGIEATWNESSATIDTDEVTGYFYVTSSLGSLCALNTATTEATVNEKNTEPGITKKVQEDSTGNYVDSATIDATDTINYQLIVTVGTGVDGDYTIIDELPAGITYTTNSVVVSELSSDGYSVSYDEGSRTLTITLDDDALADLATSTVTITYKATVTGTLTAGTKYTNEVALSYKSQTYTDSATVVTYAFGGSGGGFKKVDGNGNVLSGVGFVLQNKVTGKYAVFTNGYLTGWADAQTGATVLYTDDAGVIYASGLDADTYILTETVTPAGYNSLDDTITVTIAENGTVTYKYSSSNEEAGASITVVNKSGSLLPSTGGMGTTVLYVVGAALVIGAGVTLVVRRRMGSNA